MTLRRYKRAVDDFPDHPFPEVGHILLAELDGHVPGEELGGLDDKHPAVGGVLLLRPVLHHLLRPDLQVYRPPFLVHVLSP